MDFFLVYVAMHGLVALFNKKLCLANTRKVENYFFLGQNKNDISHNSSTILRV